MAGNTKPAAPQGTLITGSNPPAGTGPTGTSWMGGGVSGLGSLTSPMYNDTTTKKIGRAHV